jgi:hypothetical protein
LNDNYAIALDDINSELTKILLQLEVTPAEDQGTELLVSNLHELVLQRQICLDELIKNESITDRGYLEKQWQLTQTYLDEVKKAMLHRRDLLVLGQKNRRQINVYKNIDSNR